jgi:hypothetical protein
MKPEIQWECFSPRYGCRLLCCVVCLCGFWGRKWGGGKSFESEKACVFQVVALAAVLFLVLRRSTTDKYV